VIDTQEIDDGDADAFRGDCLPHPSPLGPSTVGVQRIIQIIRHSNSTNRK
jgi:hypothetical protein